MMAGGGEGANDEVTDALLRARLALGGGDPSLATIIEMALGHRAATAATCKPPNAAPRIDRRIVRVLEFIGGHLGDGRLTIGQLARVAAMSQFHFTREFKKATGATPGAYVLERRLVLARELLDGRRDVPLARVAQDCGFSTQSHFTSAFGAAFGCTPRQWRKRTTQLQGQRGDDATTLKEASDQ